MMWPLHLNFFVPADFAKLVRVLSLGLVAEMILVASQTQRDGETRVAGVGNFTHRTYYTEKM